MPELIILGGVLLLFGVGMFAALLLRYRHTPFPPQAPQAMPPAPPQAGPSPMASAPLLAEITVMNGPQAGQVIHMDKVRWSFGREIGAGVDFTLQARNISAIHCTLTYDRSHETFYLEDQRSSNGTYVNGQRLPPYEPYSLSGGVEIQLATENPIRLQFVPYVGGAAHRAQTQERPAVMSDNIPMQTLAMPDEPPSAPIAEPSPAWPQADAPQHGSGSEVYRGLVRDEGSINSTQRGQRPPPKPDIDQTARRPMQPRTPPPLPDDDVDDETLLYDDDQTGADWS